MNPILSIMTISPPQSTTLSTPKKPEWLDRLVLDHPIQEQQSQVYSTPITERLKSSGGFSPKPDWLETNGVLNEDKDPDYDPNNDPVAIERLLVDYRAELKKLPFEYKGARQSKHIEISQLERRLRELTEDSHGEE